MVCSPHASLSFTLTFRARATPNDEIQAGFRPKPAKLPDCQKSRRTVRGLFFVRDSLAWIGADMRTAARSEQLNIDGVEGLDGFEAEIPHRLMQ